MNNGVEIWWEASTRDASWRSHSKGAWFWQDDDCEEPMGPFESRAEADADWHACRPQLLEQPI